jgi:hypothetical protein
VNRRREERPPELAERGLAQRVARVEWQRKADIKRARSERFRQREREIEARYLAEREAAEKAKAS